METFYTTNKGLRIFTKWYNGIEEPLATVILVHGIGEHIHRYNSWAGLFGKQRMSVLGADLPGHGRSEGRRGHIGSFTDFFEVIDILITEAKKKFPLAPVVLYGHSMGGNIVLNYLLTQRPDIKCSVVTSPWLKLAADPPRVKLLLAEAVKSIWPSLVQETGLITDYISHDQEVITKYRNDPMVHSKISVSLFLGARSAAAWSLGNAESLNVPTLILHGDEDMLCSYKGSEIFADKTEMATLIIWKGGYHELHNEPFREEVFEKISEWIKKSINEK